jgi:hypothetical protein
MSEITDKKNQLLFWGAFGVGIPIAIALVIVFWKSLHIPRDIILIILASIGSGVCWGVGMILFSKIYYKFHKQ